MADDEMDVARKNAAEAGDLARAYETLGLFLRLTPGPESIRDTFMQQQMNRSVEQAKDIRENRPPPLPPDKGYMEDVYRRLFGTIVTPYAPPPDAFGNPSFEKVWEFEPETPVRGAKK